MFHIHGSLTYRIWVIYGVKRPKLFKIISITTREKYKRKFLFLMYCFSTDGNKQNQRWSIPDPYCNVLVLVDNSSLYVAFFIDKCMFYFLTRFKTNDDATWVDFNGEHFDLISMMEFLNQQLTR